MSKVGNPCPTLGQLLASRILYALLVGEKQYEIARARFCTQSCSKVGQLLVNSSPTPHPMGSCRGLPCSSRLATPEVSNSNSEFLRFSPCIWEATDLGNCLKSESSRKWLGEGAKGLLDPASKRPLALVQNGVAPVQKRVWMAQKTLRRPLLPGPKKSQKDLLDPPLTTFGDFPFLGNFPGPQHPNPVSPCISQKVGS